MAVLDGLPEGWLSVEEAEALVHLAEGKTVLELGAWKGRSTVLFSRVAEHVVSVDRHRGIPGHGDSLSDYLLAVRTLGNVSIVIAEFSEVLPFLGVFDLAYIDGSHDEASVHEDSLSVRMLADCIAFHDWDQESVRLGAEWLGEPTGRIGDVAWFDL